MNTTLSTKLAALMLALGINSIIMGSVALMFNTRAHQMPSLTAAVSLTHASDRAPA